MLVNNTNWSKRLSSDLRYLLQAYERLLLLWWLSGIRHVDRAVNCWWLSTQTICTWRIVWSYRITVIWYKHHWCCAIICNELSSVIPSILKKVIFLYIPLLKILTVAKSPLTLLSQERHLQYLKLSIAPVQQ